MKAGVWCCIGSGFMIREVKAIVENEALRSGLQKVMRGVTGEGAATVQMVQDQAGEAERLVVSENGEGF